MAVMDLTAAHLSQTLGEPVPDLYVVIAKNQVVGVDPQGIAELLGVTRSEVDEIQTDEVYKSVRLLVAAEYARTRVDSDFSWDDIENTALEGLSKRVRYEKDTETLLKIAAVANRAQRRTMPDKKSVLDPSNGGARIPLTLTRRLVTRRNADGSESREETQQISVVNGTAENPKFEDIDSLLGVSRLPAIPEQIRVTTHDDFSVDDIGWVER